MARITVFVDGFNLYHSLVNDKFPSLAKYKWLNITSLIGKFVSLERHNVSILFYLSSFAPRVLPFVYLRFASAEEYFELNKNREVLVEELDLDFLRQSLVDIACTPKA